MNRQGLPTYMKSSKKTHFQRVYGKGVIWSAWQSIRENGRTSKSRDIQREVQNFESGALKKISSISARLSHKSFKFADAKGIAKKRPGKTPRPIVLAPIESRIVQRAILDVIQDDPEASKLFNSQYSFGGLQEKGVWEAVKTVQEKINTHDLKYYICSDISGFFTGIKKSEVVSSLSNIIEDKNFITLFERALNTELSNLNDLKQQNLQNLFPLYDEGVAQGCCLSPLAGNIYLSDFDRQTNTPNIFCFRYIDDFLIIGPSKKEVEAMFEKALTILSGLGLNAYDPAKDKDKAHAGDPRSGFDYLGWYITPRQQRPSTKSWKRLEESIKESYRDSIYALNSDKGHLQRWFCFANTISQVSRRSEGWIKQYKHSNDTKVISDWNNILEQHLLAYESQYFRLLRNTTAQERAAYLGLYNLIDAFKLKDKADTSNNNKKQTTLV